MSTAGEPPWIGFRPGDLQLVAVQPLGRARRVDGHEDLPFDLVAAAAKGQRHFGGAR